MVTEPLWHPLSIKYWIAPIPPRRLVNTSLTRETNQWDDVIFIFRYELWNYHWSLTRVKNGGILMVIIPFTKKLTFILYIKKKSRYVIRSFHFSVLAVGRPIDYVLIILFFFRHFYFLWEDFVSEDVALIFGIWYRTVNTNLKWQRLTEHFPCKSYLPMHRLSCVFYSFVTIKDFYKIIFPNCSLYSQKIEINFDRIGLHMRVIPPDVYDISDMYL